ncbi:MAG: inositol monophosphatase [Saprospiraceae bacterium]|nr:MAG: inositol monophosphatase/fructose-1,6-bisphosphatase family protein [Bacteroidetes bacterium OLB9]MCO6462920.1 inositol monophosphatase [Saprospiraceae bacterium]MCZ2337486.1 inositol monophosphatase [Chitinophagales bacterium]
MSKQYQQLLPEVIRITNTAADFIRDHLHRVKSDDIIEKGTNSLVSYVDRKAEALLVDGLKTILPKCGFITEEETIEQQKAKLTWIIDPLDGTTNFLNDVRFFSVSVALFDGHEVVLGVVQDVMNEEVFSAVKGKGARLNGQKIEVSNKALFHEILVGTGFPYKPDRFNEGHLLALHDVLKTTRGIRRIGSAAIDLCYTACGRFGAFYENALNSFDIAAGALMVKEAGGVVTDYRGGQNWLFEGEIMACAPQFKETMLDITNKIH